MLYQMPAASAVSMRDPKTDSQYSSGNRMPPRTKASPKATNSLPPKRNIRLTVQESDSKLLRCGGTGVLGAMLPSIMNMMPIITDPPRAVARPDGETMPKEHISPKACDSAMRTLMETTHFPLQRRKDGRASLGNASHWMNGDTIKSSKEAGAAKRIRPLTVL